MESPSSPSSYLGEQQQHGKKLKLSNAQFYGREAELEQLEHVFDYALTSEGARMVLIGGYAGIRMALSERIDSNNKLSLVL
jgi:hypothetical protein